jgi:hypothetical protein
MNDKLEKDLERNCLALVYMYFSFHIAANSLFSNPIMWPFRVLVIECIFEGTKKRLNKNKRGRERGGGGWWCEGREGWAYAPVFLTISCVLCSAGTQFHTSDILTIFFYAFLL